ncbi:hypothetical protein K505DRAFT_357664 [Melanomma pulvis-pyrius CBS 109.77]|uniref:Uncharacterized protein n=1 Tax=Melanomma pulvis-pyrius CBS 109.77 TaxID=1314802 RepID=A0A6A6XP45_9PLEO|nr:hypothetical protein K505DRAFT_357664 [Melanomma pulvis-pyrius CBS 109.77]
MQDSGLPLPRVTREPSLREDIATARARALLYNLKKFTEPVNPHHDIDATCDFGGRVEPAPISDHGKANLLIDYENISQTQDDSRLTENQEHET